MSFIPTKPDVFNTGPDTGLEAVDVYGKGALLDKALPKNPSVTDYLTGKLSLGNKAEIEAEKLLSISDRLSFGLTDTEARKLIDVSLPADIDLSSVLGNLPGDFTLKHVEGTLSGISERIGVSKFLDLSQGELTTILDTTLKVLSSGFLCNDGGLDGLFNFSFSLSDLLLSLDGYDYCDPSFRLDLSGIASSYMPLAVNTLLNKTGELGLDGVAGKLITDYGDYASDTMRRKTAKNLTKNYKLPPQATVTDYPVLGNALSNNLDLIDGNWLKGKRLGTDVIDVTAGEFFGLSFSEDAKKVLAENTEVVNAEVIKNQYDTEPQSIYSDKRRFPYLYEPVVRREI